MFIKFSKDIHILFFVIVLTTLFSCKDSRPDQFETNPLVDSLLFYASFDKTTTADFAKGDPILYDTPSQKSRDSISTSLTYAHSVALAPEKGLYGGALKFNDNEDAVVFYKAQNNVNFQPKNWQGTISFWLKLDPDKDLKTMYCDPIQITETDYQNATIWIDFPKTNSLRMLRLGVLGDSEYWSSDDSQMREAAFYHRVRGITNPPFDRSNWTHVAITHDKLGSGHGSAKLYINGKARIIHDPIKDTFTWHHKNSRIYLGFNYTGLIDELKIFSIPLKEIDIKKLSTIIPL